MPIVLVRIDDRLLHGQVVEGWLRVINADYILVVDEEVAKDNIQKALYSISVPTDIKVECLSIKEAAKKIIDNVYAENRVLVLLSTPEDTLGLIESGVKVNSINVGGMRYLPGKRQISKALFVDKNDIGGLKRIASYGIELEARVLPMDERTNVMKLISNIKL